MKKVVKLGECALFTVTTLNMAGIKQWNALENTLPRNSDGTVNRQSRFYLDGLLEFLPLIHGALKPEHPNLTLAALEIMIDMFDFMELFNAVVIVSGMAEAHRVALQQREQEQLDEPQPGTDKPQRVM